jgi:hypothetical protein
VRSTLAERRPIHDAGTIEAMLCNAQVILTARAGTLLVGVSRAITDFAFCTYLSADPSRRAEGPDVLSTYWHDSARFVLGHPTATGHEPTLTRNPTMTSAPVTQELRDKFFRALVEAIMPLKAGPDSEVALEALIDASQMLTEHLQQELAELRQEQAD